MLKSETSKFPSLKYDSDIVYYPRITTVKNKEKVTRYTGIAVVVLSEGNLRHIGISVVNPNPNKEGKLDTFNRYRGREVALGRALRQMAVAKGQALARKPAKSKDGQEHPKAITIALGPDSEKNADALAEEIGEYFQISFPVFLLQIPVTPKSLQAPATETVTAKPVETPPKGKTKKVKNVASSEQKT